MLLTFALLVLTCTFGVLFSEELAGWVKKLFAIPGMKVALPIFMVNVFIVQLEPLLHGVLLFIKAKLHLFIESLAAWIPFAKSASGVTTVVIMASLPMLISATVSFLYFKRNYKEFPYFVWVSSQIWIFLIILLTVSV